MISSINIKNFRCFKDLQIDNWRLVNVVVGDNGTGKTALLEAIFLALGRTSELTMRFRQQRGLGGSFHGASTRIEEAIWRDLFFDQDWKKEISIEIIGDGPEAREVRLFRGQSQITMPLDEGEDISERVSVPIMFVWRNSARRRH